MEETGTCACSCRCFCVISFYGGVTEIVNGHYKLGYGKKTTLNIEQCHLNARSGIITKLTMNCTIFIQQGNMSQLRLINKIKK
jgi:hypothetical protein